MLGRRLANEATTNPRGMRCLSSAVLVLIIVTMVMALVMVVFVVAALVMVLVLVPVLVLVLLWSCRIAFSDHEVALTSLRSLVPPVVVWGQNGMTVCCFITSSTQHGAQATGIIITILTTTRNPLDYPLLHLTRIRAGEAEGSGRRGRRSGFWNAR